jgi:protoheme IX farnesyltransferase
MIGWAAVTGSVSLESVVLFLIIFMWTPPHFWALALFKRGDYEAARIPMLPVVAGEDATRKQILAYSLVLAPIGVAPALMGFASAFYGAAAALLGAAFVWYALRVYVNRAGEAARKAAVRLFTFSLFYLFLVFALLLGDSIVARLVAGGAL